MSESTAVAGGYRDVLPPASGVGEISVVAVLAAAARRWRLVVALPLLCGVVAVALAFMNESYSARSRFVPTSGASAKGGQLAGLAAQFGFNLGGGAGEPLDFYVDLVRSHDLLRAVVRTEYRFAREPLSADTLEGNLIQLFGVGGLTPEDSLRSAVNTLEELISVSASAKSGVVSVSTTAPWPALSEQINRRVLDLVEEFNRARRKSQAGAERSFVEARLAEARAELEKAEAGLARYVDANRGYTMSPYQRTEYERLQRQASLAGQVYSTLAQAYETARIDEVRNTPVITVLESPEGSARPGASKKVALILGGFAGLALATVIVFLQAAFGAFVARQRETDPTVLEDLRRALRTVPLLGRMI